MKVLDQKFGNNYQNNLKNMINSMFYNKHIIITKKIPIKHTMILKCS